MLSYDEKGFYDDYEDIPSDYLIQEDTPEYYLSKAEMVGVSMTLAHFRYTQIAGYAGTTLSADPLS